MDIVYIVMYDDNYGDGKVEAVFANEKEAENHAKMIEQSGWCYYVSAYRVRRQNG